MQCAVECDGHGQCDCFEYGYWYGYFKLGLWLQHEYCDWDGFDSGGVEVGIGVVGGCFGDDGFGGFLDLSFISGVFVYSLLPLPCADLFSAFGCDSPSKPYIDTYFPCYFSSILALTSVILL